MIRFRSRRRRGQHQHVDVHKATVIVVSFRGIMAHESKAGLKGGHARRIRVLQMRDLVEIGRYMCHTPESVGWFLSTSRTEFPI